MFHKSQVIAELRKQNEELRQDVKGLSDVNSRLREENEKLRRDYQGIQRELRTALQRRDIAEQACYKSTTNLHHILTKTFGDDPLLECVFYKTYRNKPVIFKDGKEINTDTANDIYIRYCRNEPVTCDIDGI